MKALTVCQPWAWAIIHGPKRVENRSWGTSYRGPLLIHAGKSREWLCDRINDGTRVPSKDLVFGAILGEVELIDCVNFDQAKNAELKPHIREMLCSAFVEGPYCWIFGAVYPFAEPIPCNGCMSLWTPSREIMQRLPKAVRQP